MKSSSSFKINILGFISLLICTFIVVENNNLADEYKIIYCALSWLIPTLILEIIHFRPFSQFNWHRLGKISWHITLVKIIGLLITLCIVSLYYLVIPQYHTKDYLVFWKILCICLPYIVILSTFYIFIMDSIQCENECKDSYYELGLLVLGKGKEVNIESIKQLFLGWLTKVFFIPLMIVYASKNLALFGELHDYIFDYSLMFKISFVEVIICIVGYSTSFKLFNLQVKSTQSTFLGWFVCLICYGEPIFRGITSYSLYDPYKWEHWLVSNSFIFYLWGILIILCRLGEFSATLSLGLRFSNCQYRNTVSTGLYKYTKHPAYIFKLIDFLLVNIPFISRTGNFLEILRGILVWLLLSLVYYLRAKTEEEQLRTEPTYVEYTEYIRKNGIVSKINGVVQNILGTNFLFPKYILIFVAFLLLLFCINPHESNSKFLKYQTKTKLELPFEGDWLVTEGGRKIEDNYHVAYDYQHFAYDFVKIENDKLYEVSNLKSGNYSYYSFNQPIYSPGNGVVVDMENHVRDNELGKINTQNSFGNYVVIDHGNSEYSFLEHFKQNSIVVENGSSVKRGQFLGLCGNSGKSTAPHIHYHLQNTPKKRKGEGLPAQFIDYSVSSAQKKRGEPKKSEILHKRKIPIETQ